MKACIISIGDELLIGQTVNTNAAYIGQALAGIGLAPVSGMTVSDEDGAIKDALRDALENCDLVITTGGLGPTKDDITKESICEVTGSDMVFSQESYDHLKKVLAEFGREPTEAHRQQCYVPSDAELLYNGMGTAPGMHFKLDDKHLFVLPGVPYEMKYIMQKGVMPLILNELPGGNERTYITFATVGEGESRLAYALEEIENSLPAYMSIAYLPAPGRVRVRVMADISTDAQQNVYERTLDRIRAAIGKFIYAEEDITLADAIGRILLSKNSTMSVAESCTGGFTGHLITSTPGSSAYFEGGAITYSNKLKKNILGVKEETLSKYGAVSEQTAREMAEGARRVFDTDYAISITGIAGPDGGTDEKPVGTVWIAVASPEGTVAKQWLFTKRRALNIELSAVTALNMLRKVLMPTD